MRTFLVMVQSVLFTVERGIAEVVLGAWDGLLPALVLFMVVEYLTQILIAVLNKKMSSEIGFCGLAKKNVYLFSSGCGKRDRCTNYSEWKHDSYSSHFLLSF